MLSGSGSSGSFRVLAAGTSIKCSSWSRYSRSVSNTDSWAQWAEIRLMSLSEHTQLRRSNNTMTSVWVAGNTFLLLRFHICSCRVSPRFMVTNKSYISAQCLQVKPNFYFDGLLWIPLHMIYLCAYDMMRIVLLKWNGEMLMQWLSEQFWGCCSCIYVLI